MPTIENFELVEVQIPEPRDGEFLVRNIWMSVDPYIRGRMRERKSYVPPFELGKALEGGCVGEVVESKNKQLAVGDYVLGMKGWRKYGYQMVIRLVVLAESIQIEAQFNYPSEYLA